MYILTPEGISAKTKLTLNFLKLKMREYDELKKELKKGYMWVILKVKNREFSILKESFQKQLGKDVKFYLAFVFTHRLCTQTTYFYKL